MVDGEAVEAAIRHTTNLCRAETLERSGRIGSGPSTPGLTYLLKPRFWTEQIC